MKRPSLQRLLDDIKSGKIDCVVCCKVDRFSRPPLNFARMMALFDKHAVSLVSVTQQFNTKFHGRLMHYLPVSAALTGLLFRRRISMLYGRGVR